MVRDRTARALDRVAALRDAPDSETLRRELTEILRGAPGAGAAAAAQLIAQRGIQALDAELAASFVRLLDSPQKSDPQCHGKRAIARALVELKSGASALEVYRAGVRHVQLEPVFGGKVDTASELRAICAQGLVLANPADLWSALVDLLADREPGTRAGAVRAIAFAGNPYLGIPLLRLRLRCSDPDPRVTAECFSALLQIDPLGCLSFVGEYLDHADPAVAEGAALALGESRAPEAFGLLRGWLERSIDPELQRIGYVALALLRSDAAQEFLLAEIGSAPVRRACQIVSALGIHRDDGRLRSRVERAVAERDERPLRDAFLEVFT